jgi:hypothetical protein
MKSDNRWTEIKFTILCNDLYQRTYNYFLVTSYIEFLAELSELPKDEVLRVLQKAFQQRVLMPSRTEFIAIAKQHKMSISQILCTLKISKRTYMQCYHASLEMNDFPCKSPNKDIEIMKKLLKAHDIFRGAGVYEKINYKQTSDVHIF